MSLCFYIKSVHFGLKRYMLAIYLTLPEVDNIRRSINVSEGLRKGKKEGRWMTGAPKGYRNFTNTKGEKRIEPNEDAPIIQWAFEELAKGIYTAAEIRLLCKEKGLKTSKANFYRFIRNPVYCGYIEIPPSKKEPIPMLAKGIHEPLITSETFEKVQNHLNRRKKKSDPYKVCVKPELPLRGFIICPTCGKKLTGSASRSASGNRHFYYHCSKGCPARIHAEVLNKLFLAKLKEVSFVDEVETLYQGIISKILSAGEVSKKESYEKSKRDIEILNERLAKARNLLLDGAFSQKEYLQMKAELSVKIDELELELSDAKLFVSDMSNYIRKGLMLVKNIDKVYQEADVILKQRIIRSIFKENLTFENNEVRTGNLNSVIQLIRKPINGSEGDKIKTEEKNSPLSRQVAPPRIELGFSV